MTNQKNMGGNGKMFITHWPNYKIKMLFPNIKEKQLSINCTLAMGNLPLFNSLIIKKTLKSIKLLSKHPNDNIQMCC